MSLLDEAGEIQASINAGKDTIFLTLADAKGRDHATLVYNETDGVSRELLDTHGFSTKIGNTGLVMPSTGETRQTSAASIRIFNDQGNVIWSAPAQ